MEILSEKQNEDGSYTYDINFENEEYDLFLRLGLRLYIEAEGLHVNVLPVLEDLDTADLNTYEISEELANELISMAVVYLLQKKVEEFSGEKNDVGE